MKCSFIILAVAVATLSALQWPSDVLAQRSPDVQWQKCLGGMSLDKASTIIRTLDGGFAMVGSTSCNNNGDVGANHGGSDAWFVKLTAAGAIEWNVCLGGTGDEYGTSLVQTSDGGYVIAGRTSSVEFGAHLFNGVVSYDAWIVRLDATGHTLWQRTYGGGYDDWANCIIQTRDGGYVVGAIASSGDGDVVGNHASAYSDAWLIKLDALGQIVWQKCLGGIHWDRANTVLQTSEGGYLVGGYSEGGDTSGKPSSTPGLSWIIKVDSLGTIRWQRMLGGANGFDEVYSLITLSDGTFIAAGSHARNGHVVTPGADTTNYYWDPADCGIARLTSSGDILWQRRLGGTGYDKLFCVTADSSGGVVACGMTNSTDGDVTNYHGGYADAWVVRLDTTGKRTWQRTLGGSERDEARSLVQTADGGFAIVGYTNSTDGDASGYHDQNGFDAWLVKLGRYDDVPIGSELAVSTLSISVTPNPAREHSRLVYGLSAATSVALEIDDDLGRQVKAYDLGYQLACEHQYDLDVQSLPSGTYHLVMNTSTERAIDKLEVIR